MSEIQWLSPVPPVVVGPGLARVPQLNATPSEGFVSWLRELRATLLVTTGDRLVSLAAVGEALAVEEHRVDTALGLTVCGPRSVYLTSRWQLHRYEVAEPPDATDETLLLNQLSRTLGFVGAYDVVVDRRSRVLFTNTLCNGVATAGRTRNFEVVARPHFVSDWVAQERCHVTGLGLDADGELAYLTCAAETDRPGGWQARVADGGVVVDLPSQTTLARGLSLPGSPRVHDDALFVTNGGTGQLLRVDRDSGAIVPVARVPGLARGLTFAGSKALLGCSMPPSDGPYAALPIAVARPEPARNGVAVIDVDAGIVEHTVTFEGGSGEVWSVALLPGFPRVRLGSGGDGWFSLKAPSP